MSTRSQITQALLPLLQAVTFPALVNGGATTWVTGPTDPDTPTLPRKLRLFSDVPKDQQPACFMTMHREWNEYRNLGVLRTRLEYLLYIYIDATVSSAAEDLDNIFESILKIFISPDNFSSGQFTINGMVYWARIEGRILKDPGDIDKQAMLLIPVIVEMP